MTLTKKTTWALFVCLLARSGLAAGVHRLHRAESGNADVRYLSAVSDFHDVTLRWESDAQVPEVQGYHVHYCELQAWGQHRCRTKTLDDSSGNEIPSSNSRARMFSVIISGLRMSTNYSFEVWPVREDRRAASEDPRSATITVPTKGFSARATHCLPDVSEVEVETGPHFGGRIAVEASDGERCAVDGDPDTPVDTYKLRISHAACGSHVNETTVATFVIVQENLPILTHSTRRFLVLCTFQPETLTVRAGLNLPHGNSRDRPDSSNRLDYVHPEAIPYVDGVEPAELVNDVQVSRLQRHRHMVDARPGEVVTDYSTGRVLFMIVVVVAAVGGCAVAAWVFAPTLRRRPSSRASTHQGEDNSSVSTFQNFENSLRDAGSPPLSEIDFDDFALEFDSTIYTSSECSTVSADDRVYAIHLRDDARPSCGRLDAHAHAHSEA